MSNPHEQYHRLRKATKLVNMLENLGIRSIVADSFDREAWKKLAEAAEVKMPSKTTVHEVIEQLREREGSRAESVAAGVPPSPSSARGHGRGENDA